MSKAGFRVLDSDLHVIEPSDLYDRYLDPAYRDRRRHARVLDRLPALRLALPRGDEPVPQAAALRAEQKEDPLGQLRAPLQRDGSSVTPEP